ncbi:hypothetical protein BGW39_003781 [Mortierella sp. 14UC]|nr:hypothetical protein BGW39_003781 [Mortierella sp. 14UC]
MATPRRSNRYGYPKGSKKKEEEDDGGQTRCVCNQQHHEGVMIQCETCKVWQHCPCVGLGDGEVTPDKYYCDSCRPENHPYRVQNGQLVSNAKPMTKPTKKRSTMNSKEASIPMDLMLAQQKWNEEHQDEIEDDLPPRVTSKRRRKTESSTTDIDDEHHNNYHDSTDTANAATSTGTSKSKKKDSSDDRDSASTSPSSSPKSSSSNGRNTTRRASAKSTSKVRSRSNSPNSQGSDPQNGSHSSSNKESSSAAASSMATTSSPKNSRSHDDTAGDVKTSGSSESSAPSTKRRKTVSKSDMPSRSDSAAIEEGDDSCTKNDSDPEHTETLARSRKGGAGSRAGIKRNSGHQDEAESREDSVAPVSVESSGSSSSSSGHQQVPSVSSPAPSFKKSSSKRGGDRGQSTRNGSRNSTPALGQSESTPQPMAPAAPATVRYPSSKMTLQEMAKRAKQMLDYISRVQIELADHKSKTASVASPEGDSSTAATTRRPSASPNTIHRPTHHNMDVDVKKLNDGASFGFRLPMSAVSASSGPGIHGDSQVCPDLSRSSMDSTSSTVDGMQEPGSPVDVKVPTSSNGKELSMTIKVIPMHAQDPSLLLSTPPLSVHDRHHHHHAHHSSGSPESDTNHEPLTPPHQPLEDGSSLDEQQQQDQGLSDEKLSGAVTSMDLMDKLTGDLIRFQEKFGAFA